MVQPPPQLVRENLNWLGYGHPDSRFWFFEYEESMYSPSTYAGCDSLTDVLRHRRQYGEFIDFKRAWEELSDFPLSSFTGHSYTWNYEAAFLLGATGREHIENRETHRFVFEDARLGRREGNNFSCEARPLPKSDVSGTGPYTHVWPSVEAYHEEVRRTRRRQLSEYLCGNDHVEWIVVSGKTNLMLPLFQSMFDVREVTTWRGEIDKIPYTLYEMGISDDQSVNLVHAPFFGQGRTSYQNAATAGYRFVYETEEDGGVQTSSSAG